MNIAIYLSINLTECFPFYLPHKGIAHNQNPAPLPFGTILSNGTALVATRARGAEREDMHLCFSLINLSFDIVLTA